MDIITSNHDMLDLLKCTECYKYLSVMPVKVYHDLSIRCGRCVKNDDFGINSMYCDLIQNMYFKCVNHFEGCSVLLHPSQVLEHEVNCKSTSVQCPICNEYLYTFSMVHHFQNRHKKQLLKEPQFKIITEEESVSYWLYPSGYNLFMITIILHSNNKVTLYCEHYRYKEPNTKVHYEVEIYNNLELKIKSKTLNCLSEHNEGYNFTLPDTPPSGYTLKITLFDHFSLPFQRLTVNNFISSSSVNPNLSDSVLGLETLNRVIYLSGEFRRKYPLWQLSLNGRSITNNLGGNISFQGVCSNCHAIARVSDEITCTICRKFKHKNELLIIHKNLHFYCIWNCQQHFSAEKLYEHESECELRMPIKCPVTNCLQEFPSINLFKTHCKYTHNLEFHKYSTSQINISSHVITIWYYRHIILYCHFRLTEHLQRFIRIFSATHVKFNSKSVLCQISVDNQIVSMDDDIKFKYPFEISLTQLKN